MRRFLGSALVVGTVAVGAIALGTTPAFAWTVTGGPFTATNSGPVVFKDTTTNQPFTCAASTLKGVPATGGGFVIAHFTSGTFTTCTGALGTVGTGNLTAATFNGVTYVPGTGTTFGTLTGVAITLSLHNLLGTCNVALSGAANNVKYTNLGVLTITPDPLPGNLTATSATGSGCSGLIAGGNRFTLAGTYNVSPPFHVTNP